MFSKKFFGTVALSGATVSLIGSAGNVFAYWWECDTPCRISNGRKAEILKMRGTELLQEIVDAYHFSKAETEQLMKDLCDRCRKESDLGWANVYYTFNNSECVKVEFVDDIQGATLFILELNSEMVNSIIRDANLDKISFKWG